MRAALLLTGATGSVGRDLAALVLDRTDADLFLLVHDNGRQLDAAGLLASLSIAPRPEYLARLTALRGDITSAHLGLDAEAVDLLRSRVTHIIHSAASTRFDLPLEDALRANVTGTQNVAALGLQCSNLRQFGFLSTTYVCGKRTGIIEEGPPALGVEFVNTYEESKFRAELELGRLAAQLPLAVYRFSTVIGHSQTGRVHYFSAPHLSARIMHMGLGAMCPGTPDYVVDFVSSDYTAWGLFELFWNNFARDRFYHLVHGPGSMTLSEIIELNYSLLGRLDPDWARRNYPMPAIVAPDAFDLFLDSAVSAANPAIVSALRALDHFAREFAYPKTFRSENVDTALPAYRKNLPDIREYYPKVIEHCLRTRWGKIQ